MEVEDEREIAANDAADEEEEVSGRCAGSC